MGMLNGNSLVAGEWLGSEARFENAPLDGPSDSFSKGTPELVNLACEKAEEAFWSYGYSTAATRADFLRVVAEEIDARGAAITEVGQRETGLPEARLEGERGRTVGQLRLFADHIEAGDYLDRRHDMALPDRAPLPRPDIRMMQRPLGPVAVFGASNFPLAFSSAGGDTASALAAGCPVVVKGHPAHPGVTDLVAQAFDAAIKKTGVHPGVFSSIQDGGPAVGAALVTHPLIRAVGFTGSLKGGRALFDLCAARPEPIPFFGELGSTNPMFVMPGALAERGAAIGEGWAGSLTMGAGQFCTNPGIAVVIEGPAVAGFVAAARAALSEAGAQTMLTDGIAEAYRRGSAEVAGQSGVTTLVSSTPEGRTATPYLLETSAEVWMADPVLKEEVFGPLGIVVRARDFGEARALAASLQGQLTATLHVAEGDLEHGAGIDAHP